MQCPDGTVLGVDELQSRIFGRGLHGLLSEAASDVHFSCSPGLAADGVTLTCLGTRREWLTASNVTFSCWLIAQYYRACVTIREEPMLRLTHASHVLLRRSCGHHDKQGG